MTTGNAALALSSSLVLVGVAGVAAATARQRRAKVAQS